MKGENRSIIAFVTTFQPETHYSRYLCESLGKVTRLKILVERDVRNSILSRSDHSIDPCWSPGRRLNKDILRAVTQQKPALIHLQHEFNMYGGIRGVFQFVQLMRSLRRLGFPTVVTLHAVISPRIVDLEFLKIFNLPRFPLAALFARMAFTYFFRAVGAEARAVIVHAGEAKSQLVDVYGASSRKVHVLPVGVQSDASASDGDGGEVQRKIDGRPFIMFFGYLLPRKGLEDLVVAFNEVRMRSGPLLLVIAGGELPGQEQYAANLRAWAKEQPFGKDILFTGFLAGSGVNWLFSRTQLSVLPYRVSISSSAPLAEALKFSCPVVATDNSVFRELNESFQFALLVGPNSPTELAAAICRVLTDGSLRLRLRRGARDAAKALSWEHVATATVEVYSRAASDDSTPLAEATELATFLEKSGGG